MASTLAWCSVAAGSPFRPQIPATTACSASAASGFTIAVGSVEGQRPGLLFYGIDNSGFTPSPWSPLSAGFLCVKPPTQRTPVQDSGGTSGACNGALSLDWNAFRFVHPAALGAPFSPGQHVFAQGWFRDPAAPKTTNLSDALEFVLDP